MSNPTLIVEALKEELEKNLSVVALVLIGSQARKTVYSASKYSDLEALIVVAEREVKKVEKELPSLVNKFGKVLFCFKHDIGFVAVYEDLFRIELPIVKYSDIEHIFSRPKAQEVKVLIDKTNGYLKGILDKRPAAIDFEQLFQDKVINFWYWQIIGVQYFKKGEIYNARAILNIHASCLIKLFELLNDKSIVLLEANKRVEQFLTKKQLELLRKITISYNQEEIKRAFLEAMVIFPSIFKEIKIKYGYQYDESIEEKTKSKILNLL